MKIPRIFAAACLVSVAMQARCFADDSTRNLQPIDGQQSAATPDGLTEINKPISFQLKPTAIAPSGAAGSVELKSPTTLAVHLSQLGPGKYKIQAIRRSDGKTEWLGTITIVDPTLSPSRQATDNKKEASANPELTRVETDAAITLHRKLVAKDIGRIQLLGPGDNAVLDSLAP